MRAVHHTLLFAYLSFIYLLAGPSTAYAANDVNVKVGSYHCPPFVIESETEKPSGLSIYLWEQIAAELGVEFEISHHELGELLEQVSTNTLNIGVSCISITPEREEILDFSHSFYETHLAIAVKQQGYLSSLKNILTNKKLLIVLGIAFVAAGVVGGIYYLLEHRVNDKLYSMRSKRAKMIEGFILGLLFITKGPFNYYEFKTLTGRVLTVLLAIFTTFFIASITAILASTFTLGLLNSDIKGPNDLANLRVGAKAESTSSLFLTSHSIVHQSFESTNDLLKALDNEQVEAIVADDAVLKYLIKMAKESGNYESLSVLPYQFEKQNYGLVLENNSPHREKLNRALLKIRQSPGWHQTLNKYFADK
ncbi:substrate-binding periplasmic protein [Photobacterium sp. DNB23_23_1]|uniref:Transporter substrate-binding domain-containing protein n=1 Tax=Photobacterium pectinilyticum TaxID=2906793 RepID=A0ABT1MZA3_9GAMM|nr:transporter substrate-binding domain-containing protein [Photobacterium sp. ZSDE20]MCQ1056969.1 transporter substrate-binding domain-containing protein [Photobacterium sp. ZSDE20]MDD1821104.1 transporter substrate-binding domain-containing protein [Photobacterium sp. ZSDE20]